MHWIFQNSQNRRWHAICHMMLHFPEDLSWIYLGGRTSSRHIFALDVRERYFADIAHLTYDQLVHQAHAHKKKDSPYLIGLCGYDVSCSYDSGHKTAKHRIFEVLSFLTVDEFGEISLGGDVSTGWRKAIQDYIAAFPVQQRFLSSAVYPAMTLLDQSGDAEYLKQVVEVQNDIRSGRFYQLNLLRYFSLKDWPSYYDLRWKRQIWRECIYRFFHYAEEMSALFCLDQEMLLSFSPERFVRICPQNDTCHTSYCVDTYPVKGTMPRVQDVHADLENRNYLQSSTKDCAELSMIIDLMRHDIAQVSQRGSVEVKDAGSVRAYSSVYHRVGWVRGILSADITMQEWFAALLPAGSITGAPKVEVMSSIARYEQRSRGYFMGCAWYLAGDGVWDSSVLIRTAHISQGKMAQYAAGSGIVIQSDPQIENREILAKCAMWHDSSAYGHDSSSA